MLENRISEPVVNRIKQDVINRVKSNLSDPNVQEILEPIDLEHAKDTIRAIIAGVIVNRYGEISFRSFCLWFKKNLRLFNLMLLFLCLSILLPIAADQLLGWLPQPSIN